MGPGHRIERYELVCPIASGGMGSVWAARLHGTRGFERIVAIKTVLPDLAADPRVRAMFLDEARLASGVFHRNVAHILDFLERDGALYLVMEWVDGASLATLHDVLTARRQRIPQGILLRILSDVCAGLHAAHELRDGTGASCELVHRDVSPQNVLVGVEGAAKLIDFGVAKARHRAAMETTSGALKGKLHYMAPEQALGDRVDRRADVWSVGAMAFYMLTGHGPFDTGGKLSTLRLLVSGAPCRPLPPDVHPAIANIISGCLARRPQDRFATAEQLGFAIEEAIEDVGASASARDVGALVADCVGPELAQTRANVRRGASGPEHWVESSAALKRASVRRRAATWVSMVGLCAMPAVPFAVAHAMRAEAPPHATVAAAHAAPETPPPPAPAPPPPPTTEVLVTQNVRTTPAQPPAPRAHRAARPRRGEATHDR